MQLWISHLEIVHTLAVEFHDGQVQAHLEQELGEHTHARPHLQHRQVLEVVQRVGNALGDRQIGQEMLPQ